MLKNVDVNTDFDTWQKINAELTEIDVQLNYYYEQLKAIDRKVAYSTVNLSVREVVEYTETEEKGFGEELWNSFKSGGEFVADIFKFVLEILMFVLPFRLISGVVGVIVLICIRTSKKKKRN